VLLRQARECLLVADFERAEHLLRCIITRDPRHGQAYELLGKLLYRGSRSAEAAAIYRAWLDASPTDPVAAHLVSATTGEDQPPRSSNGFIESVFGRAAPDFDATLAKLNYRAPQLLFESAMAFLDPTVVGLDILDLGCGTGLCADWFRPLARRIVGVDLAPQMLAQAGARGCYDELICQEITAFATRCTQRFDLITAADVLCYFGDLSVVLAPLSELLRSSGHLLFSVEELPADLTRPVDERSYRLLEHGRYAHNTTYVHSVLCAAGLTPVAIRRAALRSERGAPVHGLVSTAKRG